MIAKPERDLILRALQAYRGDDLERAERAFAGLSDAQLDRPYGQSGKTCRQILEEYREHVARVQAAAQAVLEHS